MTGPGAAERERDTTGKTVARVPRLALRRPEAAAALGISEEVFDESVRPFVPVVRRGRVAMYPTAGLLAWLNEQAEVPG